MGNLAAGWERYRCRLKKKDHDHRHFPYPEWNGEKNEDLSLLIFSEQGIGDVAMFATCLPEVLPNAKQVTLEVDPRMVNLFQRSFPEISVIPRIPSSGNSATSIRLTGIDQQISIADLPALFRKTPEQFTPQKWTFHADRNLKEKWRQRYAQLGSGLKIGISWFGGKNHELQSRRAIPLERWEPVLKTPGIHWINLQYGTVADERWEVGKKFLVPIHDWSDSNPMLDLDDFSAKISELDLVISIDNATVHFAGCLGVPTWCLLSSAADWRWGHRSEKSVWYDSLTLIRQTQFGDWDSVLEQVSLRLKNQLQQEQSELQTSKSQLELTSIPRNSENSSWLQTQETQKPRCAIISPIGPGHQNLYEQTKESIRQACEYGAGPFCELIPFRIDDSQGQIGAFRSRNEAVKQAASRGIEWVFFLDADDLLVPQAFCHVEPLLEKYDAIWGQIYTFQDGTNLAMRLEGQLPETESFTDLLQFDPSLTLKIGHFVRTEIALQNPFNETMPVGADYDYYLRIWKKHRCLKLNQPLFASRKGSHSSGPETHLKQAWKRAVSQILEKERSLQSGLKEPQGSTQVDPNTIVQPEDLVRYWKQDRLANVIPRNRNRGEFPEGWNVRSYLQELLLNAAPQKILELGCGYGRLCQAFPCEQYLGLDINPEAIQVAQLLNPEYRFETIPFESEYPRSDVLLAYTLLLHIDDLSIGSMLWRMCQSSPVILIAEILGKKRWRRTGNPPVFNRDLEDYQLLMQDCGYKLSHVTEKPYAHYADTNISFLKFLRNENSTLA